MDDPNYINELFEEKGIKTYAFVQTFKHALQKFDVMLKIKEAKEAFQGMNGTPLNHDVVKAFCNKLIPPQKCYDYELMKLASGFEFDPLGTVVKFLNNRYNNGFHTPILKYLDKIGNEEKTQIAQDLLDNKIDIVELEEIAKRELKKFE